MGSEEYPVCILRVAIYRTGEQGWPELAADASRILLGWLGALPEDASLLGTNVAYLNYRTRAALRQVAHARASSSALRVLLV